MDRIADILKESIGLDVVSVGWSTLERAVTSRMSATSVSDVSTYEQCVRASRAELQALIEAIVVPETWFFRDREAFAVLVRTMLERRTTQASRVRVLSVPSSTGEEPYSIAMALLDAGLAPEAFQVDAIDVSGEAIARATTGRYGRNSFRGRDLAYRARHFEPVESDYRVSSQVRNQVTFRQGSLFAADVLSDSIYDAIFCRNLLIYFDRATQDRAVRTLRRRLTSDGLLFVAPSEAA
jgi:chemotaxis protein methyltransferase WspC